MKNFIKSALLVPLLCAGIITGYTQTPVYSSYTAAPAVIFLDFDGHTVNGTSWNVNGPIPCGASGLDPTQVTEIFNRVAEDYRPFNINITTDSTKYWSAPSNRRMRVILTVSSEWYGSSGGVAFTNSFSWGDNTPCFVFTALLNNNVKMIAEAASHEAGHTLGLRHQSTYDANCVKVSDYNYGQGSGEIGWAPIMGVGYYKNFTLWHNGPNSISCNNLQSDLDVITNATNGFGFRSDDHTDLAGSATTASFASNQFTVNGVVERTGDKDLFRFTQPSFGVFRLDAIPYNVGTGNAGSDLDLQVTLLNSSQVLMGTYNPDALLHSVIDTVLGAGIYYLRVEGRGNEFAPEYASLGSYALQGTYAASNPLPLRRLELTGTLQQGRHALSWIIDADEQVTDLKIEVSPDGTHFSTLTQTSNNARSFAYKPYLPSSAAYRLNVSFDNGRQYYSNTVTIRQSDNDPRPHLVSNMITAEIKVSSPGQFDYIIYDANGKTMNKGRIGQGLNTINSNLMNGIYVIRFTDGVGQWSEKFIRQ